MMILCFFFATIMDKYGKNDFIIYLYIRLTVNRRHQTESHRMSRILLPIGSLRIMSVLL